MPQAQPIGGVVIDFVANTAQFNIDLAKVGASAATAAGKVKTSAQGIANDFKQTEAAVSGMGNTLKYRLGAAAADVGNFYEMIVSGGNYARAATIELPKIFTAFGPVGEMLGLVAAAVVGVGAAVFGLNKEAKDTPEFLDKATSAMNSQAGAAKTLSEELKNADAETRKLLESQAKLELQLMGKEALERSQGLTSALVSKLTDKNFRAAVGDNPSPFMPQEEFDFRLGESKAAAQKTTGDLAQQLADAATAGDLKKVSQLINDNGLDKADPATIDAVNRLLEIAGRAAVLKAAEKGDIATLTKLGVSPGQAAKAAGRQANLDADAQAAGDRIAKQLQREDEQRQRLHNSILGDADAYGRLQARLAEVDQAYDKLLGTDQALSPEEAIAAKQRLIAQYYDEVARKGLEAQQNLLKTADIIGEVGRKLDEERQKRAADRDPLGGAAAGLYDIETEIFNVGKTARETVVNDFDQARDALESFVLTGKADFKGLITSMITDLGRLALRIAEADLVGLFVPGASTPGAGAGSSWLSTIFSVGASILGGAVGSAGASSAAQPGVTGVVGGGYYGTHAEGGAFRVGGTGGGDNQLVQFRANPGELVEITPPGQHRTGSSIAIGQLSIDASGSGDPATAGANVKRALDRFRQETMAMLLDEQRRRPDLRMRSMKAVT